MIVEHDILCRHLVAFAWVVGTCGMLGGCATPEKQAGALFEDYWQARLSHSPTWATDIGEHRYNDRLDDLSIGEHERWSAMSRHFLDRSASLDRTGMSAMARSNCAIFERQLRDELLRDECHSRLMPIKHQGSPHLSFPLMLVYQPFETPEDYRNYISRLWAWPAQVDQVIANCREGLTMGYVRSRVIIEKALPQIQAHLVEVPADSEFHSPINKFPDGFSETTRQDLAKEIELAINEAVIPGYKQLDAFVVNEYLPATRVTVGIWDVPDGDAIYDKLIRYHTTTEMSADEIHQIGLDEIARIRNEMDDVRVEMGFSGSVDEFITYMTTDPRFKAASGQELMALARSILDRTEPRLSKLFNRLPKARCGLKEIEAFRAASAPAAYAYPPAADGSRSGYYYVNTYEATKRPTYTMEALSYHEAYPGHLFQIPLDLENPELPMFRRYGSFTAYIEGWALYAEGLGFEIGGYQTPESRFGRHAYDAWRAARLVVDTGIHRKRWTRQQAVDYMKTNTGLSELNINSEVDRYIAWPGQALAYKIGELTIRKLRAKAEMHMGDSFDVREFHDELLSQGAQPLSILTERMNRWIAVRAEALTAS
ncbi:MAG: X-Pro dipeptidyl-peptidase [Phycisphaerae bacterium]|nr:MAG: X-Pro dipeptidyl-peptidase [Phycisphaerae bacterium]